MTVESPPRNRLEYQRRWRALNKEKVRAYEKRYKEKHPEKSKAKEKRHSLARKPRLVAYKKQYRLKNLEECRRKNREWQQRQRLHRRKYMKGYYKQHSEGLKNRAKHYYQNNPGKHSVHIVKRKTKINTCPPEQALVINQWMRQVRSNPFARCYWCGTKVSGSAIHFDHVIALSKGGTHSIGNLCASCPDCNMEKHARLLTDWVVNGQTFLL